MVPVDSRSYILIARDRVQAASAALVRAGHLVGPLVRVSPVDEAPVTDPEQLKPYVGAWRLSRRERGPKGAAAVEEFDEAVSRGAPVRIQAANGLFVDFRVPEGADSDNTVTACFGTLS